MRAQRVQRLFYSYVKGFSPDSRELAEAGFVWKQDGENAELAFPGEKASLWENYVAAHLPCGYWNEYLQEDSVVFLFQLPDGFRRYEVYDFRNEEVLSLCNKLCGCTFPSLREMLMENALYRPVIEVRKLVEIPFEQMGTCPLQTARLVLRRFSMEDAAAVFQGWTGDPGTSRFVMAAPHASLSETEQLLETYQHAYQRKDFYMWAITWENMVVGYVSATEQQSNTRSISIGYCLNRRYWGRGFATEAASAVIDYLFGQGFYRVFGYYHPLNPASGRVLQKCGMKFEGVIRGGSMLAGEICDCVQYSRLRWDPCI